MRVSPPLPSPLPFSHPLASVRHRDCFDKGRCAPELTEQDMATRVLLRPAPASATLLRHTPNVRPSRKKTSTSTAVSVRSEYRPDEQEEVPAAARIFATGVGLMLNAAGFAACYELNPSMRILAQFIEETQNPSERREGRGWEAKRKRERERRCAFLPPSSFFLTLDFKKTPR